MKKRRTSKPKKRTRVKQEARWESPYLKHGGLLASALAMAVIDYEIGGRIHAAKAVQAGQTHGNLNAGGGAPGIAPHNGLACIAQDVAAAMAQMPSVAGLAALPTSELDALATATLAKVRHWESALEGVRPLVRDRDRRRHMKSHHEAERIAGKAMVEATKDTAVAFGYSPNESRGGSNETVEKILGLADGCPNKAESALDLVLTRHPELKAARDPMQLLLALFRAVLDGEEPFAGKAVQ